VRHTSIFASIALAVAFSGGCTAEPSPGAAAAIRADAFVDSVGVNVHLSYTDTAYGKFSTVVAPSLEYLGVRHVRSGLDGSREIIDRQRTLAGSGIRLAGIVPYRVESMPTLLQQIRGQADTLDAVEGPNETDEFLEFRYLGQRFPRGTTAFMRDFSTALEADPGLRDLPVLQTTLAFPQNPAGGGAGGSRARLLGDLSAYVDYGNSHNYFARGDPPGAVIARDHLPYVTQITPGKPFVSTEGGYQTGDSDGYQGGWNDGQSAPFDERVHARYMARYLLEMFRNGYSRSYIYELLDIDQPRFGLFRRNGSPKPAARGIHAMLSLLNDASWDATARRWTTPEFTPESLAYSFSTVPKSLHSMLMQKSTGVFWLVVWNEVRSWNPKTGKPLARRALPVNLTIGQGVTRIRTFVPTETGSRPRATFTTNTVPLRVGDRPLIVEIDPR
jgi:hypothetical protein